MRRIWLAVFALAVAGGTLADRTLAGGPDRIAYVLGSNDGSLARLDLDSGVLETVAFVGVLPNRIERSDDGTLLAIANSTSDDVAFFDVLGGGLIGSVALPAGSNPWAVELTSARAFVTGLRDDRLYAVDPLGLVIVDSAETGAAPEGLCVAGGKLYVANTGFHFDDFSYETGTVSVFDAGDLSLLATIAVGTNPQECILAADGRVHVICTGDFFGTQGSVAVIDPTLDAVVDSFDVPGYPGGAAAAPDGVVYLNVTTLAFGSEIWSYDATTLTIGFDASNPLLPSFDFYGNLRTDAAGRLFVPVFGADLLLAETPIAPGSPSVYLINDGPIDLALVPRFEPVSLSLSGLRAENETEGIRLRWHSGVDAREFVVERREAAGEFRLVGTRDGHAASEWLDASVEPRVTYTYRVGARWGASGVQWADTGTVVRTS
jgi:hypothetical protein